MAKSKGNQGFTLTELVFVILIISILVAATVPNYFKVFDRAWQATDTANLKNLNSATWLYRELDAKNYQESFLPAKSNQKRLSLLKEKDFLDNLPSPREKNKIFFWDKNKEKWIIADEEREDYDFYQFAKDLLKFIHPIPGATFTVNANIALLEGDTEAGLLFDYSPDENGQWKGFILQIEKDKGQGAVVLRRIIDDQPGDALIGYTFNHNNTYVIPDKSSTSGQEWWSSPHRITLEVNKGNQISGYIDNYLLFDDFHLPVFDDQREIYTGFLINKGNYPVIDMEVY